jgi:hypothetical protein
MLRLNALEKATKAKEIGVQHPSRLNGVKSPGRTGLLVHSLAQLQSRNRTLWNFENMGLLPKLACLWNNNHTVVIFF